MTTAILDRPTIAPDDPRHGSVAGWCAGCRGECCRAAAYQFKRRRHRLIAYGRWNPWVDAAPVREHIQMLSSYGMGWRRVAEVAGVPEATVSNLVYPSGTTGKTSGKCRPSTAEAILAVKPTLDNLRDRAVINATGTVRRLRALIALGHTMQSLSERLQLHPEVTGRIARHATLVSVYVARRTVAVYDELSTVRPEGPIAERTRRAATGKGWVPPLAWDDAGIDDPNAQPDLGDPEADVVDEVAVRRALAGERIRLTTAEKLAAFQAGYAAGMSTNAIATALHISGSKIQQLAAAAKAA